jgi:hypothetical protein
MKTLFTFAGVFLFALIASAKVSEGRATINKADQPAVIGDFDYNPNITEYVLMDDLKTLGFGKGSDSKGYRQYQGIVFNQLSSDKIDLFVKVDKNRKDKNRSLVYMLVSKDNNFVSSSDDSQIIQGATDYLNSLIPKFASRKHDLDVAEQEDVVKKAEKKYNSLVGKGESLLTKKRSIEDDIIQNKKDQDEQQKVSDKERDILRALQVQNK